MGRGMIQVFYGPGKGKTSAAIGQALRETVEGQHIAIIQFLKGKVADEFRILKKLEPDVQIFRFDQSLENYNDLSVSGKEAERQNIRNGFNYAKKVIETGQSEVIILDELLGVIDLGILEVEDVISLLQIPGDYEKMLITGSTLDESLVPYIDVICEITMRKDNV